MESPPNPPRAAGIYEIRNVANCKVYVGSARLLAGRRQTHWRELKHGKHWNQALQADWCQFGESSFVFEVLEEVKELDLLEEREQFWINQKQSNDTDKGYNLQKVAVRAGGRKQECYVNLSKRSSGQWWIRFRLPPSMLTRRVVSDESCSGFSKPDVHGRISYSLNTKDRREAFRLASTVQFLLWLAYWDALTPEVGKAMELAERNEAEYHLNEARRTLDEQGFKIIESVHNLLSKASQRDWDYVLKRASRNHNAGVPLHS